MWKIVKVAGILIFLAICSLQDIKEKKLSVRMLILSGVLFLVCSLLFDQITYRQRVIALLPGMWAFVLAFLTREQIGYGDAACLAVLGNAVSADILFGAVMGGLILLSICSVILLAGKKADRKTTLPFVPFLMAGMLWQMFAQKGWNI